MATILLFFKKMRLWSKLAFTGGLLMRHKFRESCMVFDTWCLILYS
jgi:hypothetical protein